MYEIRMGNSSFKTGFFSPSVNKKNVVALSLSSADTYLQILKFLKISNWMLTGKVKQAEGANREKGENKIK